jgi:DNA-binding MarR family transcriptional regulator
MKYVNESLGCLVYKARYLLKNTLQKKLKDYNISTEQWSVLNMVYIGKGCNQKCLAEMLFKDRAALTRILDILENKKLIKKDTSPNDRREFLVYLTDSGLNLYGEALTVVMQNTKDTDAIFTVSEVEQLKYLLNKLILNLK